MGTGDRICAWEVVVGFKTCWRTEELRGVVVRLQGGRRWGGTIGNDKV